mmetsp:Transcript_30019/g.86019  ORF Transcript_30019/g.86019 Transcript_30019/m.86019 type:complete len:252 (+) Transcript_30019:388-1143(+)
MEGGGRRIPRRGLWHWDPAGTPRRTRSRTGRGRGSSWPPRRHPPRALRPRPRTAGPGRSRRSRRTRRPRHTPRTPRTRRRRTCHRRSTPWRKLGTHLPSSGGAGGVLGACAWKRLSRAAGPWASHTRRRAPAAAACPVAGLPSRAAAPAAPGGSRSLRRGRRPCARLTAAASWGSYRTPRFRRSCAGHHGPESLRAGGGRAVAHGAETASPPAAPLPSASAARPTGQPSPLSDPWRSFSECCQNQGSARRP